MRKQVIKRNGSIEDFHPEKISRVLEAAGMDTDEAVTIAKFVEDWVISRSDKKISSLLIRDKVLERLLEVNPTVANLYAWYQKTKEIK